MGSVLNRLQQSNDAVVRYKCTNIAACSEPNLLVDAPSPVSTALQCPQCTSGDPQAAAPTLETSLPGQAKSMASSFAEIAKTEVVSTSRITPTCTLKLALKSSRHVHGKCWATSPPLRPQTCATKAMRAIPSRIISCLKPNLLETAESHISVVTAGQCRWSACDLQVVLPLYSEI